MARQGRARQGRARLGTARLGKARHGMAGRGTARHGPARQGQARHGTGNTGKRNGDRVNIGRVLSEEIAPAKFAILAVYEALDSLSANDITELRSHTLEIRDAAQRLQRKVDRMLERANLEQKVLRADEKCELCSRPADGGGLCAAHQPNATWLEQIR